jgi:hypothetical protein
MTQGHVPHSTRESKKLTALVLKPSSRGQKMARCWFRLLASCGYTLHTIIMGYLLSASIQNMDDVSERAFLMPKENLLFITVYCFNCLWCKCDCVSKMILVTHACTAFVFGSMNMLCAAESCTPLSIPVRQQRTGRRTGVFSPSCTSANWRRRQK